MDRAESDARILAEATAIKKDKARFMAAKEAGQTMADNEMKEVKALHELSRARRGKI